jgi:CheY-like chemotaxis protein
MPSATKTVLLVDDDPELVQFMAGVLSPTYRILTASNGNEALRIARQDRPDVILLDVMMPGGKDGFATFAELQQDARTSQIPVLMQTNVNRITGLAFDAQTMQEYLGKAPTAFLQKPVQPKQLLEAVSRALAATSTPPTPPAH